MARMIRSELDTVDLHGRMIVDCLNTREGLRQIFVGIKALGGFRCGTNFNKVT